MVRDVAAQLLTMRARAPRNDGCMPANPKFTLAEWREAGYILIERNWLLTA
jgi:hypothetical protein